MGGSSTQVAFVADARKSTNLNIKLSKTKSGRFHIRTNLKGFVNISDKLSEYLGGAKKLYSKSFLGNGGNQLYA